MSALWHSLIINLAFVALAISIWAHTDLRARFKNRTLENVVFGLFMGLAVTASMMMAVEVSPGHYVDVRAGLMGIAALFGGPVPTAIGIVMGGAARLYLGGAGAVKGIIGLGLFGGLGLAFWAFRRKRGVSIGDILILSIAVPIAVIAILVTTPTLGHPETMLPTIMINGAATLVCGLVILVVRRREQERAMLRAALEQVPDFLYIKDLDSRFLAVNRNTAEFNHFGAVQDMVGLSDFALVPGPRAEMLYFGEQEIMRTGVPMIDKIEHVKDQTFMTSKVPIREHDGHIVGLAGVTRDITEKVRLGRELRESQELLARALEAMSDGFAIFDREGEVVTCNKQFQTLLPVTGHFYMRGARVGDILRASALQGEVVVPETLTQDEWVNQLIARFQEDCDHDIRLSNGRWLNARVRWSDDNAVVVVSDVTTQKESTETLRKSAEHLKSLAELDGLTGLANRRAFEDALTSFQKMDGPSPFSVLMIDVDHFKAFNDRYGHQSGDECLRKVGACLRRVAKRPKDFVARYGGEEFIALLPDTNENGAATVAADLLAILRREQLPHSGSPLGHVTVSIGIASSTETQPRPDPTFLIGRADAALYAAKKAGRDRSCIWGLDEDTPRIAATG